MLPSLHQYAKDGSVESVQELLETEPEVNTADQRFGKTPLCWAAEHGQVEVVELLLNHAADFNLADLVGRKPLLWAARNGHRRIVHLLLDRGDGVDSRDNGGRSPLSLAAREGYADVARLLVTAGDEVDSKDLNNQTPLSFAAMNGHLEVVQLLIEMGADVDSIESSENRSPLSFAAEKGCLEIVKCLLAVECEINSRDSRGRTPLSWAAANGDGDVIEALLTQGAALNSKDEYNRSPLSYASELGKVAVVKKLLQTKGIEFDFQDNYYDQTPLSWAAEGGDKDVVSLLLEMGADADTRDRAGHTPLLWAVRNGHPAVVELLLEEEVEVIVRDEENWTPLSLAADLGDKHLTQRLLLKAIEINSKVNIAIAEAIEDALWRAVGSLSNAREDLNRAKYSTSLDAAAQIPESPTSSTSPRARKFEKELSSSRKMLLEANHATVLEREAVVNLILENDEYLNIKDYKQRTLLSWAAEKGHDEVLKLLISRDLSPDSADELNRTPISWAARGGHESTVVILLDKDVYPDWRDGAGRTPLSLAAEKGHEAIVTLLLNIDADLTAKVYDLPLDLKKKPAGLYSAPQGSSDNLHSDTINKPKLEHSVDFDSRDNSGQTPLMFAAKEGHRKVVSLLLDKGANIDIKAADNKSLWQLIEEELQSPGTDNTKAANLEELLTFMENRLADGLLLTGPMKRTESVDAKFNATVVHFIVLPERKRDVLYRRCTVLDLLNDKMTDKAVVGKQIACKWLHVPANNMRWVEVIMARHFEGLKELLKQNIVLKEELWTKLQHRAPQGDHHARFMRPTCQALPIRSSVITKDPDGEFEEALKGLVLFMPYLHWETEDNLNEMKEIIREHEMVKSGKIGNRKNKIETARSCDYQKNKELVQAYLDDKHPLHIRRTLDQFYYHTLKDTDDRDRDQTGTRYHKNFGLKNKKIVTMVDQLWLWVLPGFGKSPATVITSFPQRSNRVDSSGRRNDEKFTSLFSNIIVQTQDRLVENGHDLAEIIASECSRTYFDTMTDRDRSLQFLEIYASSIGEITDKEAKCFARFQKSLEVDKEADKLGNQAANLPNAAEDALSIKEEIQLLQEVKDIRDELNIMLSVFTAQRKALRDMARIMYKTGASERRLSMSMSSQSLTRFPAWNTDLANIHHDQHSYPLPLSTVDSNISEVNDMDKYAERAYMALNHLLDLKQKQANVLEAKATHKLTNQAIIQGQQTVDLTMATSSQGKMITFFTLITIVFMPLSFMAAFFAINIAEFPRDADGLSLGYVSKYMFSISVAIIAPSIIIAFNLQNIEDYLKKLVKGRPASPPSTGAVSTRSGSSSSRSSGTQQGGVRVSLDLLEAEGRRKQKLCDEEQGRKSANSSL